MLSINQLEQLPNDLIKIVANLIPTHEIRIKFTEYNFLIDLFFDTYPDLRTLTGTNPDELKELLQKTITRFIYLFLSNNFIISNKNKYPPISFLLAVEIDNGTRELNLRSDIDLYKQLLQTWLYNTIGVKKIKEDDDDDSDEEYSDEEIDDGTDSDYEDDE